ncbi:MAG: protein-tyrosine-phosphatase [Bacteroidales bacterium]|nr:protein-tyrosine-phosphatase [Bacteroidales bacterium]
MKDRPNVLIVCSRNRQRSRTAEYIFKNDSRFNIRSVGLRTKSERKISEKDILWAEIILAMEDWHKNWILGLFRHLDLPTIEVLGIDDDYEYLDNELINLLKDRINNTLKIVFKI